MSWLQQIRTIFRPPKKLTHAAIALACVAQNVAAAPDQPEDFGYKVHWFAIKTNQIDSVVSALDLGEGTPANWTSGIRLAYEGSRSTKHAFVSPPVNGWVFVVGSSLPYPVMHKEDRHDAAGNAFDKLFSHLAQRFPEVQYFGSHRVMDYVGWARAQQGIVKRVFAFGDGEVYANLGKQTAEEAQLKLPELSGLSTKDATTRMFADEGAGLPDEDTPCKLAALWSVNPCKITQMNLPPGSGFVVRLPTKFRDWK